MEDENDLMSIFDSGMQLNMDYDTDDDIVNNDDIEDNNDAPLDDPSDENNKPIEDEDPENVDGEEDDDNEGDDSDDDSSLNLYSSISNVLFEQGIIPSLESSENVKTADDFVNVIKNEVKIQAEKLANDYIDNLDLSTIASSRKTQLDLERIDEDYLKDNLEVAKEMILRDYMNQGLSQEKAERLLKKTIDLGEDLLVEDALESKESLKEYERRTEEKEKLRYKEQLLEQEREQEQINTVIKNTIYNSKEIFNGVTNTKTLQDRVFKTMTEPVAKDPTTGEMQNKFMQDRSANPIEFDIKMYYLYELTNGFKDLKPISTKVESKAVKNLEKVLRKTKFEDNGLPNYLQDPESYGGIGSELVF